MSPAAYYTATVDHWSITGQPIIRSSSLRQCMRYAARFNDNPPEAEINVYQHVDGHDPPLFRWLGLLLTLKT